MAPASASPGPTGGVRRGAPPGGAPARLGAGARPAWGKTPVEGQLAALEGMRRQIGEPHPALELALRWLGGRVPPSERVVVVHGDYRLGNFIVDPARGLGAGLGWELSHLGDPGEDLGWVCMRFWRS